MSKDKLTHDNEDLKFRKIISLSIDKCFRSSRGGPSAERGPDDGRGAVSAAGQQSRLVGWNVLGPQQVPERDAFRTNRLQGATEHAQIQNRRFGAQKQFASRLHEQAVVQTHQATLGHQLRGLGKVLRQTQAQIKRRRY